MEQDVLDLEGHVTGRLTGPWWLNDTPVLPEEEYPPEEAFFRIESSSRAPVTLRLTAHDFYQVWLNGQWLGCGPARAEHGRLTVDEWQLPASTVEGKNVLTIQVFWEGIFTFDHVRGTPGLWFALDSEGQSVSSETWISGKTGRIARHRFSHQRGWIEEIDGRERAAGWPAGPWNPGDWSRPVLRTTDPAVALEARDIKPFTKIPMRAKTVAFVGSGNLKTRTKHRGMFYAAVPGFEGEDDIPSAVMQEETLEPAQAVDQNISALAGTGTGVAILGPDARGFDRTVQLNFEKLVSGTLHLTLEAPAGTVVDFGWSEGRWSDPDMGAWARTTQPGGSAPAQELNDSRQGLRYICAGGGVERFSSLFLVSFQRVRIAFRCPEPAAAIRVHDCSVVARGYPITPEGTFVCSDESLNRIHDAAIHTMACSIDDVYMDCPGRERGGYNNDSYWTSLGFLDVTGDAAYDRRYLRQFFKTMEDLDGVLAPCYPSDSSRWRGWTGKGIYVITGHTLYWLLQCERHLRLFRDARLEAEWKPKLAKVLATVSQYRTAEGLLENVPWDTYFDWSSFQGGPITTGDNFLYALTLLQLGNFYGESDWLAQGRQTAQTIEQLAWDPGRELYADTVVRSEGKLAPGSSYSAAINQVALWSGLCDPSNAKRAWRQLREFGPTSVGRTLFHYETNFSRSNLVGLAYRFVYQGRLGELREMIRDVREAYEPMFARGQTTLSEHLGYQGSLCHGYNGYLVHLFTRYLAGIELPEYPGEVIRLRPHPDVLSWCQSRVCWMDGHVQVWWSRNGGELEIIASLPAGQKGELIIANAAPVPFTQSLHTKLPI